MKNLIKRRIVAVNVAAMIVLIFALKVMGTSPDPEMIKLMPSAVSLDASPLPPKLAATEEKSIWQSFDRNTDTAYTPKTAVRIIVSFLESRNINLFRIYGSASYRLNIYRDNSGLWEPVASLCGINLEEGLSSWNSHYVAKSISSGRLLLEFLPNENISHGISEIEIWGDGASGSNSGASRLTLEGIVASADLDAVLAEGPSHILEIDALPSELSVSDRSERPEQPFVTVTLDQDPSLFKRAYLAYDAYDILRPVSVQKRINSQSWTGGFELPESNDSKEWKSHIEEISPSWLIMGENKVEFLSAHDEARVRNVRIVLEAESGWNSVASLSDSAAYDGDTSTSYAISSSSILEINFERPVQPETIKLNVNGPINASAELQYLSDSQWQEVTSGWRIDLSSLGSGWNEIRVPAPVVADSLRLVFSMDSARLKGGASVGGVNEVRISASSVGKDSESKIVVSYPRDGEYFGRTAYIQGFVTPAANDSGTAKVNVEGKKAQSLVQDGSFSLSLNKDETDYYVQADDEEWRPVISVDYSGTAGPSQTLVLNKNSSAVKEEKPEKESREDASFEEKRDKHSEKVSPGQAKKIKYGGVTLDIPEGAVETETEITIMPLTEADLAMLDPGMINVTSPYAGYRLLPHGTKFKKPVKLSFGYSKTFFAAGQTDDEVNMYYYNESTLQWEALTKVLVDKSASQVTSETDHFTDIINGTLVVPEHPQALSFNPNSIKDIKAGDPSSGVNLIEAPKGNNMGDARLSYPIEIPQGRKGMQPNPAVQYNSSGGNGWMGLGWDIPMQAISVETRWGVPRYSTSEETETYILDGEQLAPVAHRGALQPRSEEKTFHPRIEGQFRKIVRHGNSPSTYWWEVTDKNGTRYFYGGSPESGLASDSILATEGNAGNIFKWALREMRDTNGNSVRFKYALVQDSGINGGSVAGYQLYLKTISYTGYGNIEGPYAVTFIRDRELVEPRRPDVTIDARGGFKMVTADLLKEIEVSFKGQKIRSYKFFYQEGAFRKTLLQSVAQYGKDGTEFNRHNFGYYDEARNTSGEYRGFEGSNDWSISSDGISAGLMGQGIASALGGTSSEGVGGHVYIGVGTPGDQRSKVNTAGVKIGYNTSESETLLTMADMDGDSLPDKVFKGDDGFYYRKNLSGPEGNAAFGSKVKLSGLSAISKEEVTTYTIGIEAFPGYASVMNDSNYGTTESDTYFSDVNGDGLTDLVNGGTVLFGYLNAEGVPTFGSNSANTPVPIGLGTIDTNGLLDDPAAEEAEIAENFPLLDTVRRWVAPYEGTVRIEAPVRLIQDTSEERALYEQADGVRVAIQLENSELWSASIEANNYAEHVPTGVSDVFVHKGDRIYFRVQSVSDGNYDQVSWSPAITYVGVSSTTDVNNLNPYSYQASQDFTLAGRRSTLSVPLTGTLRIEGRFEKTGTTTDDVTLQITQNGSEVYSKKLAYDKAESVLLSEDIEVSALDELEWRILVDSPIDITRVRFTPNAYYTAAQDVDNVKDDEGNYVITVNPPYSVDLYPDNNLTAPQESWIAPMTGVLTVIPRLKLDSETATPAEIAFTVKKKGVLLKKDFFSIEEGQAGGLGAHSLTLTVPVTAGDELFFDFSSTNAGIIDHLTLSEVKVSYGNDQYEIAPSAFHNSVEEAAFPQPYRGWAVVGYNGNEERATSPIDQSLLVMDDSYDPNNAFVYPFVPNSAKVLWGEVDENAWVKPFASSSSRMGLDTIVLPRSEDFSGASAPTRISKSTNTFVGGSAGGSSVSGSAGSSTGDSQSEVDFQDLNGDRFPDVIGNGGVQYTQMTGELESGTRSSDLGSARSSENESFNMGMNGSGSMPSVIGNSRGSSIPSGDKTAPTGNHGGDMPKIGFGGDVSYSTSETEYDLLDMNGDGLADKVYNSGNVSLNLGYSFAPAENWGGGEVNKGETLNGGVNLGYNSNSYSLAGGVNLGIGASRTDETYVDINGDGLLDKVYAGNPLTVSLNTGTGFSNISWDGGHDYLALDKHISLGGGVYFTVGFNFTYVRIVVNPGVSVSASMGRPEYAFRDMDGDGFADHVRSESDGELKVARNQIGKTNLLKSVTRPLGGRFEIQYKRTGNTYEVPHSKWIMTDVNLSDGMGNDYETDFSYGSGHYDRYERDFFGFDKVVETQAPETAIARTVTQTFNISDYSLKGLVQKSVTSDNQGRVWAKTANSYEIKEVKDGSTVISGSFFPSLSRTDTYYYTGGYNDENNFTKSTFQEYDYDEYGNVVSFMDAGDEGAYDDVYAAINYWKDPDSQKYIVGKPDVILVKDQSGGFLRKRWATYESGTGNLRYHTTLVTANQNATWAMTYDEFGNVRTITDPAGYVLTYTYDPDAFTYVAKIQDNFTEEDGGPYYSSAEYNLLFGQLKKSVDLNLRVEARGYDEFGRLACVYGPYETAPANPDACTGKPAISFEYKAPQLDNALAGISTVTNNILTIATAVTKNKAVSRIGSDGNTLDTVTYADGMKRILQTKKEADVNGSYGMVVSGKVIFDQLGRTIQQGQPIFESGYSTAFSNQLSAKNPTTFAYDTLDRTLKTVAPDNATTTVSYGFGSIANSGPTYFMTKVMDPEGNKAGGANKRGTKVTYKDVGDRIQAVVEYESGKSRTTGYEYDPLGQITKVTDNKGNITTVEYDYAGRRTTITNPDTGKTQYEYDANGNLTAKATENYPWGKEVRYEYVMNRLVKINYPYSSDVTYEYGAMNEAYNRAGRIKKVTDESGIEERYYGNLGEITKEEKTVTAAKTYPVSNKKFTTEYAFDSFGRMLEMTYPDGEELTYSYDNGGLLKTAWGEKSGNKYNYINTLQYDEFGQRTKIEYGNGVKSTYTYDPYTRRLDTLVTTTPNGQTVQNMSYSYDMVGNVMELGNNISTPTSTALPAGPVVQSFEYDDLYQLTQATGTYSFGPGKQNKYTNLFQYDTIGNMSRKLQAHKIIQPSAEENEPKATNYDLNYIYGTTKPHAVTDAGDKTYTYDNNGNMTGWDNKNNGKKRTISWNEENRVTQISDNGSTTYFTYDDSGERVIKRGKHGETLYLNRFYAVRNGELGTKHIYAGETKILSKLVKTSNTVTYNTSSLNQGQQNAISNGNGKKLGIIKRLDNNSTAVNVNPPVEKDQFYYHGDHLGSSNMITNSEGEVYQHLEYFPYGESWIEEGGSYGGNTPGYKFTGKELDPETGLYYFGARYYEPVISKWISADPASNKYLPDLDEQNDFKEEGSTWSPTRNLPGMGGVYRTLNLNNYIYATNNPIILKDPDGRAVETPWDAANVAMDVASLGSNVAAGNYVGATVDAIGLVIDSAATAVPGVPGGAGTLIKTARNADKLKDSFKIASQYGLDTYKALKKHASDIKKMGEKLGEKLEVHHLLEKRFADILGKKKDDILSIVLTKGEHAKFTKAWKDAIKWGEGTLNATKEDVMRAAEKIYKDYPELLEAIKKSMD